MLILLTVYPICPPIDPGTRGFTRGLPDSSNSIRATHFHDKNFLLINRRASISDFLMLHESGGELKDSD